ncbi:hypothetical protein BWQ96_07807 [Gracilariopsis chorda]|uniref:C3H1-type domain-containing protein n=1 Tax=Gracilariopsis chorda TaxID=448386 RepID=A0A2V3IK91_9FLOR|nr:hypothetical protein BWQ96_07807 [Gracilariopsis chorda]|eukprot:PXF42469.1 hypothetical protein BWQ96_07807 [Gracilariopsis chorda]
MDPPPAITSSSVSSPSAPHSDGPDEVDELLDGIDRVRIDDLWQTPRHLDFIPTPAPFRAGLFAPPRKDGIAAIAAPTNTTTNNTNNNTTTTTTTTTNNNNNNNNNNPTTHDFPRLFKVYPCRTREQCLAAGTAPDCFFYHSTNTDRRRLNVSLYKPHMCRFIDDAAGCRKADRCPFSHNDFERRYHPDRFGKETCRDYLRGDCPRRYCTFRHEVSTHVQMSLAHMHQMSDKELLQLVLKMPEAQGRALCEKLLRRFGHAKKHSGWKLQGFDPRGREEQKVRFVTARVEQVKRSLKAAGEKKWACTLKTSSLRDMMSGVRKVAEEVRERCRADERYGASGSDGGSQEVQRLIRAIFSNTNWSCHSQEGDNPFLVTPENQNDAMSALEKLVHIVVRSHSNNDSNHAAGANTNDENVVKNANDSNSNMERSTKKVGVTTTTTTTAAAAARSDGWSKAAAAQAQRHDVVSTLWACPSSLGHLTA